MTDKKISELTSNGTLTGSELVELVQSGSNVKALLSAIKTWVINSISRMRARVRQQRLQRRNATPRPKRRTPVGTSRHQTYGGAQGVADSFRTTLTYSDIIAITPGAHIGQYTFRGNSCFDPDYTSTGHQPQYFDQMSVLYTRYRVYGSRISITAANEQVGSALQITVIPSSEITAFTTSTYPLEHPYAKPMQLLGVGGLITKKVTHKMTTQKILGLRAREILDQDYSASTGATPSSVWYWQIVAQDLSSENVMTSMQVVITYDVEFYDRNVTTPSTTIRDPEKLPREQRLQMAFGQQQPPGVARYQRGLGVPQTAFGHQQPPDLARMQHQRGLGVPQTAFGQQQPPDLARMQRALGEPAPM